MAIDQRESRFARLFNNTETGLGFHRTYHAGVVLMHLERLRAMKWHQIWTKTAENHLLSYNEILTSDQDVLSAVLMHRPDIVYTLPCQWNIQLSETFQHDDCRLDQDRMKARNGAENCARLPYNVFFKCLDFTLEP